MFFKQSIKFKIIFSNAKSWSIILLFNELMSLKSDRSENIDIQELELYLPETPKEVLEQFYRDHGRKSEFQLQYKDIDISLLRWDLIDISFNNMRNISIFHNFQKWVEICCLKSSKVLIENNWNMIGHTPETNRYWEKNSTWMRAPIMLKRKATLHLVEGHSRYGCLKGLVNSGAISPDSLHSIWLATMP